MPGLPQIFDQEAGCRTSHVTSHTSLILDIPKLSTRLIGVESLPCMMKKTGLQNRFRKDNEMEYYVRSFPGSRPMASADFQQALRKGQWEIFINGILQRLCTMTPFEVVRTRLNLIARLDRGRQEIRLDQIIGSVGKCQYFTRSLWPLSPALEDRWINIYELMLGPHGYPPIDVFQVKDRYFILDGHHRASVARALGNKTLEAYVIEWPVLPT